MSTKKELLANTQVAAIQMVSSEDVNSNLDQAFELVQTAAGLGAKLLLLPENFAVFNSKALYQWSEPSAAATLKARVASWANDYAVWIVAGTLPQRDRYPLLADQKSLVANQRVRTSSLVFSPLGELQERYDKIHLFDVDVADAHGAYRESETIEPGDTPKVCSLDELNLTLGLSVCYDLRFPELYRVLAAQGANLLTVPAAFTWETGKAHWETLLRARAIENQCYVLAANQGGQHTATRQTWGHSMIIDPWGDIIAMQERGPGVVMAPVDRVKQAELRRKMPVQQHRVIK